MVHWTWGENDNSKHFHQSLAKVLHGSTSDSSLDTLAGSLFSEVVPTASLFSQILVHIVNFYLGEDREDERSVITRLAALETVDNDKEVMRYAYKALSGYFVFSIALDLSFIYFSIGLDPPVCDYHLK